MNTANQEIRPITYKINDRNHIEIGGCDLYELAKIYGTPLYIFDEATIISILDCFNSAFDGYEIHPMYASKAFMTQTMCKLMQKYGFGLDCVSQGELYTAKTSDFDMSKIVFNGNNKTKSELEFAIRNNVGLISLDNFYEAELLNSICEEKNIRQDILLRVTPNIECHTHEYIQTGHINSKFGFDLSQTDEIVKLITTKYKNLHIVGLHAHIGSQIFELQVYNDEIEVLFKEAKRLNERYNLDIDTFNIGGGLGIKYVEKDTPVSIYEFADTIKNAVNKYSEQYNLKSHKIYFEMGRCIVGTAGVTLYETGSMKTTSTGKKYVSVNGGMADNIRVALYQADYTAELVDKSNKNTEENVTIAGKYCESGDILLNDVNLPKIKSGDLICFYTTGAYGYSMASNYNRAQKPASVLVGDGKHDLIIKRESLENLVQNDVIPERLRG